MKNRHFTPEQERVAIERNMQRLIERHGLRPSRAVLPQSLWGLSNAAGDLDHARLFVAGRRSIMLIVSNYDGLQPPAGLAMEPHPVPLYSTRCKSFIRIFSSMAGLRAVIREASRTVTGPSGGITGDTTLCDIRADNCHR